MITLIETTCKDCGIKLSEFEAEDKNGYCMDCSKEKETPIVEKPFSLKNLKKRRAAR